jgi:hypothetical protein
MGFFNPVDKMNKKYLLFIALIIILIALIISGKCSEKNYILDDENGEQEMNIMSEEMNIIPEEINTVPEEIPYGLLYKDYEQEILMEKEELLQKQIDDYDILRFKLISEANQWSKNMNTKLPHYSGDNVVNEDIDNDYESEDLSEDIESDDIVSENIESEDVESEDIESEDIEYGSETGDFFMDQESPQSDSSIIENIEFIGYKENLRDLILPGEDKVELKIQNVNMRQMNTDENNGYKHIKYFLIPGNAIHNNGKIVKYIIYSQINEDKPIIGKNFKSATSQIEFSFNFNRNQSIGIILLRTAVYQDNKNSYASDLFIPLIDKNGNKVIESIGVTGDGTGNYTLIDNLDDDNIIFTGYKKRNQNMNI